VQKYKIISEQNRAIIMVAIFYRKKCIQCMHSTVCIQVIGNKRFLFKLNFGLI